MTVRGLAAETDLAGDPGDFHAKHHGEFEVDLVDEIADAMCDETEFDLQTPPPETERHLWVDAWKHAEVCYELALALELLSERTDDPEESDDYEARAEGWRDEALDTGVVCWGCWEHMGDCIRADVEHGRTVDDGQGPKPACADCYHGAQAEAAALVGP